jgi:uncharacterized SAM-binding protein YcdF (DUF218 family)
MGQDHLLEAIVLLGCRVRLDPRGRLRGGTLARRIHAAARVYAERGGERTIVIASGGRRWAGFIEADVMARELASRGVPESAILRERCSLTTRDNARFAARVLERRGIVRAAVVTSESHLPRAVALFCRAGVEVDGVAAPDPQRPRLARFLRLARERVLRWVQTR